VRIGVPINVVWAKKVFCHWLFMCEVSVFHISSAQL
jgi:hypothetical protein